MANKKNPLGIKIGTKDEAFWTEVKRTAEIRLEEAENTIKLQKEVIKMCKNKILLEKRKS